MFNLRMIAQSGNPQMQINAVSCKSSMAQKHHSHGLLGPLRLFYSGLRLNGEPCMWNLGLQRRGTPGSSESCCRHHPQNEQFSCNCKQSVCSLAMFDWEEHTEVPTLGEVGVFIWFCCSILDVLPLHVRNRRRGPQRSSPNRGIHSMTQIKWASANTAVVPGASACPHASGLNWPLEIDCSSGTLPYSHFDTFWNMSVEPTELYSTCAQYGGSAWPLTLWWLRITIRGSPRVSLAHCLFF